MSSHPTPPKDVSREQRSAARRTALVLGLIAVAVYATFILSGVIGR